MSLADFLLIVRNLPRKEIRASIQTQTVKLFLKPEKIIEPGSKITVTQNGVTTDYASSGKPAVYETHQEVILELKEKWS